LAADSSPASASSAADRLDRNRLLALLEASRAINEELHPAEVCRLVARHAAAVLRAESASVLLHDTERDELIFHAVADPGPGDLVGHRFPADRGIAGQVLHTRRSVRIDDVSQNRNFYPEVDKVSATSTRSLLAVPLVHQGTVLGVVEAVNRVDGRAFDEPDLDLLEVFANLVAGAARNALRCDELEQENRGLRESRPEAHLIGRSLAFTEVLDLCRTVAPSPTTVLLCGDSGTGKEMAARTIHDLSPRAGGPFVAVNCAALPESLIESELFGHEAGAFTGATSARAGKFELAHRGTLLLDELGELDPALQAKLLRVLEACVFTRVGGTEEIACDVRIIGATNRDLRAEAEAGRFREDLYYRLSVFPIRMPALRERADDVPLLVEHLLAQVAPTAGTSPPELSDEAMRCLMRYAWPGNVRELRNVVERAALLAGPRITPEHLPPEVAGTTGGPATAPDDAAPRSRLAEEEHRLVLAALEENDWNQSAAARQLGISRDILRSRVRRYGLRKPG
jgi:transcriptional regulator with GAF, ATPase, and Fis domain